MSELNDPRVLFAAERTLMAWNRTSVTFMVFGFGIERFGLFLQMFKIGQGQAGPASLSFWIGISFVLLGVASQIVAIDQYKRLLVTLQPAEIPRNYRLHFVTLISYLVALLGLTLCAYLFFGTF